MSQNMSPSKQDMTNGQIDKAVNLFRSILEKNRSGFTSGAIKRALDDEGLAPALLEMVRKYCFQHERTASWCDIAYLNTGDGRCPRSKIGRWFDFFTNPLGECGRCNIGPYKADKKAK